MIEDYERFGVAVPKELEPPRLYDVELYFWEAFVELTTDRNNGGPIPYSSIREYAKVHGDNDSFTAIIRRMDRAYLTHEEGQSRTFTREMMRN